MLEISVLRALVRHFEWRHVVNWADSKSLTVNENPCGTLSHVVLNTVSAHALGHLDGTASAGTVMTDFGSHM